jgi:hypothetical protein
MMKNNINKVKKKVWVKPKVILVSLKETYTGLTAGPYEGGAYSAS